MTTNKPMTGEQLDELMSVAVRMQRDTEADRNFPSANFAYAVQVAVLELRGTRAVASALAAENAALKNFITSDCHVAHVEPETFYEDEVTRYVSADGYEPETPATDAFLAEVRAQGAEGLIDFCGEENSVFVESKAYYRSLSDAVAEYADQLRQGASQ